MIVLFIYKAPLNYQKGAMADDFGLEPKHDITTATASFQDSSLTIRVNHPYGVGEGVRFPNATLEEWSVANYTTPTYGADRELRYLDIQLTRLVLCL